MAWRLRRDYAFEHPKTDKTVAGVSFHEGWVMGCPLGTSKADRAKTFTTKAQATAYSREKLRGRGYQPERI